MGPRLRGIAEQDSVFLASGGALALDVEANGGTCGVMYFMRANRWHGSPWGYTVDGVTWNISTDDTAHPNQAGTRSPPV